MTIPKTNHQLWIGDNNKPLPKDIIVNIQSWHKNHPDFTHIMWTFEQINIELNNFYDLNLLHYINQCRFPAMQSDLIRLALIYKYGGFWNDLKNFSLKPLLQDYTDEKIPVLAQHWPTGNPDSPTPHIANSFMAAPQHDPLIWRSLVLACSNIENRVKKGVFGLTGGGLIASVIQSDYCDQNQLRHHLIPYSEIWDEKIKRMGGSYNDNNKHWSIRQKIESPFINK